MTKEYCVSKYIKIVGTLNSGEINSYLWLYVTRMLSDVLSPDRDNGTHLLGHRHAVFNTQDFFLFLIYYCHIVIKVPLVWKTLKL